MNARTPAEVSDFRQQPLPSLLASLATSSDGLGSAEASLRLQQFGPNEIHGERRRALLLQFLAKFRNPLVIILLGASGLSALTGEVTSFCIILAMVTVSVTLDFAQEYRAGEAADRLRRSVEVRVHVLRDGLARELPMAEVVPGDVALLAAGDLVPGDGRVLESRDFFVNEALLTGEPFPVEKHAPAGGLMLGTSVISGTARLLICRTGPSTALGAIADTLRRPAPATASELGLRQFGLLIMRMTVLLVLFVLLVNGALHRPWLESFLFALALAVGLTPELLPMVVSVTLARGALRMAARQVIVKRLAAVQDLGSMDVLCSDKTGTLTEARIRLERHVDPSGRDSRRTLELAYANSYFETGLRSALDDAILAHAGIDVSHLEKLDEVPFDFDRRRVSVLLREGTRRLLVVKGAPEEILRLSISWRDKEGAASPLDRSARAVIDPLFAALGREGFRVLGIASREVTPDHDHAVVDDESALVFEGFAAFLDPPKQSAREALADLSACGIDLKIVTGDNELVTQHVCAALGLPVLGVLTGADLDQLDDAALRARVARTNLFCRVNPAQKNRVILALKRSGRVVGYLGDGINDAPSLHSADIGISVDDAVDVAKAAADLILLRHDLRVLHDGVMEGRRTFANIMKYIMMGTSSNFGNMFSMAGAALLLPFLPMLPLQILLNNLLYDVSELPIPLDRVDDEALARPRHWDMALIRNFMLSIGPISSVFDFLAFWLLLSWFDGHEARFHTGWFIESLASQVLVIFVIRTRLRPWQSRPHPLLLASSLGVVGLALALPFTPVGAALGFVPLPPLYLAALLALVGSYLLVVELAKGHFFRR